LQQVGVQLPTLAVNVTLPAFAAKRRAAAPLLLSANASCTARLCGNRSIFPARRALSSKPQHQRAAGE